MLYDSLFVFSGLNFSIKLSSFNNNEKQIQWNPNDYKDNEKFLVLIEFKKNQSNNCCAKTTLTLIDKPITLIENRKSNFVPILVELENLKFNKKVYQSVKALISIYYSRMWGRNSNFNSKEWLFTLKENGEVFNHPILNEVFNFPINTKFKKTQEQFKNDFTKEEDKNKGKFNTPYCYHNKDSEDWKRMHFYENYLFYQIDTKHHENQILFNLEKYVIQKDKSDLRDWYIEGYGLKNSLEIYYTKSIKELLINKKHKNIEIELINLWKGLTDIEKRFYIMNSSLIHNDWKVQKEHSQILNIEKLLIEVWALYYKLVQHYNINLKELLLSYKLIEKWI